MISAGQNPTAVRTPTSTPKARGIVTISRLPKTASQTKKTMTRFFCGGGWIPVNNAVTLGQFLRKSCVAKMYGLYKDYSKGTKGAKTGKALNKRQQQYFNTVLQLGMHRAYFHALMALERRAVRSGGSTRVKNIADANYANQQMYNYVQGISKFIMTSAAGVAQKLTMEQLFAHARKLALRVK